MGDIIGNLLLFLVLPPIIGLPVAFYNIVKLRNPSKSQYYTFFFVIAAYLGVLNATKTPGGDQYNYMIAYMHVPAQGLIGSMINIYGAIEAKSTISAEFMNGIYNYIGYYLTFGNYPLFICLFTFAMYMFVFAPLSLCIFYQGKEISYHLRSVDSVILLYVLQPIRTAAEAEHGSGYHDVCYRTICTLRQDGYEKRDICSVVVIHSPVDSILYPISYLETI